MKRLCLAMLGLIVMMMWVMIHVVNQQDALTEEVHQIHKETSAIYGIFSGYDSVTGIDLIYN